MRLRTGLVLETGAAWLLALLAVLAVLQFLLIEKRVHYR